MRNKLDLKTISHYCIEDISDGIYISDAQGYTLKVNKAYEKISGYKASELEGRHLEELVQEGYFSPSAILVALEKKTSVRVIQKLSDKYLMIESIPLKDEQGRIYAVFSHIRDYTIYKNLENEYKKIKQKLGNAIKDRYKDKIFTVGHNHYIKGKKMEDVLEIAWQVAPYPTAVFLYGESGTGKEIVAKTIVEHSNRANKPFIKVNCGAIPEQLLESELFGYEAGAFTGAHNKGKPGLIELADKGTILLDEIGDLPINMQVKLNRILQEKEIIRVGGTKTKEVDVRILSSTHKDLDKLVENGLFREDLFYRLNVIKITIPPLRERKDEIIPLAELFLTQFCNEYSLQKKLSNKSKEQLLRYSWPGNIRELFNVIEKNAISTKDYVIDDIAFKDSPKNGSNLDLDSLSLKEAVEKYEKELICEALKEKKNINDAAKKLKIDRTTLSKKIKRLGLKEWCKSSLLCKISQEC